MSVGKLAPVGRGFFSLGGCSRSGQVQEAFLLALVFPLREQITQRGESVVEREVHERKPETEEETFLHHEPSRSSISFMMRASASRRNCSRCLSECRWQTHSCAPRSERSKNWPSKNGPSPPG